MSQDLNNTTDPGAGTGGTSDTGDTGGDDTGDDPNAANKAAQDATNQTSNVTQQGLTDARPTEHIGYFAAMLSRVSGSPGWDRVFQSQQQQDHEAPNIIGTAVTGGGDVVKFDGTPGTEPILQDVDTNMEGAMTHPPLPLPVTAFEIGFNAWQEWGFWEVPGTFMIPTGFYSYMLQGVYVHGDPTPKDKIAGIYGHYQGNAWGILQMGAAKSILTGTMEVDLVMGSPTAQNFKVLTQDSSGNKVDIFQTGAITFSGPNGEADLYHTSNVDMQIGGMSANTGRGTLGVFGPNGEAVGGTAGMEYSGDAAVVGFQGTK